ncbi:transposase family protein [Streptomyces sp. NPDC048462]|uniref:transposase family protein n=1 Tax=Streptomyces sp. NPDC048462 TaxID=3365555 RepID=UPI00371F5222
MDSSRNACLHVRSNPPLHTQQGENAALNQRCIHYTPVISHRLTGDRRRRRELPQHQRVLTGLAYLRKSGTPARIAAGFDISAGTAHARTAGVVDLPATPLPRAGAQPPSSSRRTVAAMGARAAARWRR